jgi:hypothetical protein
VFTSLLGTPRCMRCGLEQEARIQTYLFKTGYDNAGRDYSVGESEVVDGLEEFDPLYPWDSASPLVLAIGDWDCKACGLSNQWAKLTLSTDGAGEEFIARIEALETFTPWAAEAFAGVHGVEPWLADLARFNIERAARWADQTPEQRCEAMAAGFNAWCAEVAMTSPPAD